MFELIRSIEESVVVDGFNSPERAIRVTVLGIKNGKVRLGFEVNKDVARQPVEPWQQLLTTLGKDCSNGGV